MPAGDLPTPETPESPKSTLSAEDIIAILLQEGNARKAVQLTIARDPINAYSFYKYVRQKIFRNEANRDPQYLSRVRYFQHVHYSPQEREWKLLEELMAAPLRIQYRVEKSSKLYLPEQEDDYQLKNIHCLPPPFYEYRMPWHVVQSALDRLQDRREARHAKAVTIGNLQTIVSKAKEWRERSHPWELVACASILCGRRTQEITHTLEFEPHSTYQLRVQGLLKQEIGRGVIPILCTTEEFEELMAKIRAYDLAIESSTHRLKPAFRRVFGEWFNHTERRNIYCEAAWRMRDVSGFFPEMSKIMWFDKALCHDVNVVAQTSNLAYQALGFDE